MKTDFISTKDAIKMAIGVGKKIIDKGEANGGKITLDEIKDVFESSVPKNFIPMITDDEKYFQEYCQKFSLLEAQQKTVNNFAGALTLPRSDCKGHFIYLPKGFLNNSYGEKAKMIAHEFFHTLFSDKNKKGQKMLKKMQEFFEKGNKFTPEMNQSALTIKIQDLLKNAFRVDEIATQPPEFLKLYSRLQKEKRILAYVRTCLRTFFDPRLKKGEQKHIAKLHLPIEKKLNPDSIAVRPTKAKINFLNKLFKEEFFAYAINMKLEKYYLKVPPESVTTSQIIAANLNRSIQILNAEKEILAKNK